MSHNPPLPDAAVSPYPPSPGPAPQTETAPTADERRHISHQTIGIAAGAAIGSAAIAAALIFYNRPATPPQAVKAGAGRSTGVRDPAGR
jgi:hypothetical protein